MNVLMIPVRMVEVVWMELMNTVETVFLDTLDPTVEQVGKFYLEQVNVINQFKE